jgi:hypothetical protein
MDAAAALPCRGTFFHESLKAWTIKDFPHDSAGFCLADSRFSLPAAGTRRLANI